MKIAVQDKDSPVRSSRAVWSRAAYLRAFLCACLLLPLAYFVSFFVVFDALSFMVFFRQENGFTPGVYIIKPYFAVGEVDERRWQDRIVGPTPDPFLCPPYESHGIDYYTSDQWPFVVYAPLVREYNRRMIPLAKSGELHPWNPKYLPAAKITWNGLRRYN